MLIKKKSFRLLFTVILLLSLQGLVLAVPLFRNLSTNVTYSSIQEAINSANENQAILIYPTSLTGAGNINVVWPNVQNITLLSSSNLVIDAQSSARHFIQQYAVTWNLVGITLINGSADYGGSILITAASPSHNLFFDNGVVSGNYASGGGGAVYSSSNLANIYFRNSSILGNSAATLGWGNGGGFGCNGNFYLRNDIIMNNQGYGGVIAGSTVWASDTIFQSNRTITMGSGGVFSFSSITLNNCTFNNNVAENDGGVCFASNTWMTDVYIYGNSAGNNGGAFCSGLVSNTIRRATILENVASNNGGAFSEGINWVQTSIIKGNSSTAGAAFYLGTNNVMNSLIVSNDAGNGSGKGAAFYQGDNMLVNNTLAKNCPNHYYVETAGGGVNGELEGYNSIFIGFEIVTGNPLYFDTVTLSYVSLPQGTIPTAHISNTINFTLMGFVDFGNNDYRLTGNSVTNKAIDGGLTFIWDQSNSVNQIEGPVTQDLAGSIRITGSAIDIGAYEAISSSGGGPVGPGGPSGNMVTLNIQILDAETMSALSNVPIEINVFAASNFTLNKVSSSTGNLFVTVNVNAPAGGMIQFTVMPTSNLWFKQYYKISANREISQSVIVSSTPYIISGTYLENSAPSAGIVFMAFRAQDSSAINNFFTLQDYDFGFFLTSENVTNGSGKYQLKAPTGSWDVFLQVNGNPLLVSSGVVIPPSVGGVDYITGSVSVNYIAKNLSTNVEYSTIQAALSSAVTGNSIQIYAGTHTGAGNVGLIWPNQNNITLKGTSSANTVLDAQTITRHILIKHSVTWTLKDISLINGRVGLTGSGNDASYGGSILVKQGDMSSYGYIYDSKISGNMAYNGGALFGETNCALVFNNVAFNNNTAVNGGGAIYSSGNTSFLCEFKNNRAVSGGVLYDGFNFIHGGIIENNVAEFGGVAYKGYNDITAASIRYNMATGNVMSAGGVFYGDDTHSLPDYTFKVRNSVLAYNQATDTGGAFYYGTNEITNCSLNNNVADSGGAFYYGTNILSNSKVYSNSAVYGGGAFYGGTNNITNTSVYSNNVENVSFGTGGAFFDGTNTLNNSSVYNNIAFQGGAFCDGGTGVNNLTNCRLYGNTATDVSNGGGCFYMGRNTLINVIADNNTATIGSVFFLGNNKVLNSTFVANNGPIYYDTYGFGINGELFAYNTIFVGDFNYGDDADFNTCTVSYCAITDLTLPASMNNLNPISGFNSNQFVNQNSDFRLIDGSVAIERGSNALWFANSNNITLDIASNDRITGSYIDLGAYESSFLLANYLPSITLNAYAITVNEGAVITFSWVVSDPDGNTPTITISGWINTNNYTTGYSDSGLHYVTVSASDGYLSASGVIRIYVNNVTPTYIAKIVQTGIEYPTIQEALNSVNAGQTIDIYSGTYSGANNINLIWPNLQNVTLRASTNVVLDAQYMGRHFVQNNAVTWNLIGLTLIRGTADYGGSILITASENHNLYFINGTISGNSAQEAAGIFSTENFTNIYLISSNLIANSAYEFGGFGRKGTYFISNCLVKENICTGGVGEAGFIVQAKVSVDNTVFENNIASNAGGVFGFSTITLNKSTFINNSAFFNNGGVFFVCDTFIKNSTFTGNTAAAGGGVFSAGTHRIDSCTFNNNLADNGGVFSNATSWVQSSKIIGNSSLSDGAAFYEGTNYVMNSLIASNDAKNGAGKGAAFYEGDNFVVNSTLAKNCPENYYDETLAGGTDGEMEMYNSIVIGNFASTNSSISVNYSTTTISYSGVMYSFVPVLVPPFGMVYQSPLPSTVITSNIVDTQPSIFRDFGNNDYRLTGNSNTNKAINTASNNYWYSANSLFGNLVTVNVDLAGQIRVYSNTIDIGAYESSVVFVNSTPSITLNTSAITVNEGAVLTFSWTLSDPDNDPLTITILSSGNWLTTNNYMTTYTDSGLYSVTVSVSDGSLSASKPLRIYVTNVNRAPGLTLNISAITVNIGEIVTFSWTASDPDGNTPTISITGWKTTNNFTTTTNENGLHYLTVNASDGLLSDSKVLRVYVTNIVANAVAMIVETGTGYTTIQAALNASSANQTVLIITSSINEHDVVWPNKDDISLVASPGISVSWMVGTAGQRHLLQNNARRWMLKDIQFTYGRGDFGGSIKIAISSESHILTIDSCQFFFPSANYGGAVYAPENSMGIGSRVNVINSTFNNCLASMGGVFFGGVVTVKDSYINKAGYFMGSPNPSTYQGSVMSTGKIKIENSYIGDSGVTNYGGVFYDSGVDVIDTLITGSVAQRGGVFSNSAVTVNRSSIIGSVVNQSGAVSWLGSMVAMNSVFSYNQDGYDPGGIFANQADKFINCVLVGNSSAEGIWLNNTHTLINTTIVDNDTAVFSKNGSGSMVINNSIIYGILAKTTSMDGTTTSLNYSICTDPTLNAQVIVSNSVSGFSSAQFVDYANKIFSIISSSVAINAGSAQLWNANSMNITCDITGALRTQMFGIDLGAYESSSAYIPGIIFPSTENFVSSHIDITSGTSINVTIPSSCIEVPVILSIVTQPTVSFTQTFTVTVTDNETGFNIVSYNFLQAVEVSMNSMLDGSKVSVNANSYLEIELGLSPNVTNTEDVRVYFYNPILGRWSVEGITIVAVFPDKVIFRTTHLTYFSAVKLEVKAPPTFNIIGNLTISENQSLTITLNGSDSDGATISYTIVGLPQTATFNTVSNNGIFNWTPNGIESGVYSITFSIVNSFNVRVTQNVIITVNDINGLSVFNWTIKAPTNSIALIALPVGVITSDMDLRSWVYSGWTGDYVQVSNDYLVPGKGFWAKVSTDIFIDLTTANLSIGNKSITVTAGWNIISLPQVDTIDVQNVLISWNGQTYTITAAVQNNLIYKSFYGYTGTGYSLQEKLLPYTGYWFNAQKPLQLIFPWKNNVIVANVQGSSILGLKSLSLKVEVAEYEGETRTIELAAGDMDERFVDVIQAPKVPGQMMAVSSVKAGQQFEVSQVANNQNQMSWELRIEKATAGNMIFKINEIANQTGEDLVYTIEDLRTLKVTPIGKGEEVVLAGLNGFNDYIIHAFSATSNLSSSGFTVINYPNPFDSKVENATIKYEIPSGSYDLDMTVTIYTRHGKKIITLSKTTTLYTDSVQWDGTNAEGFNGDISFPNDVYYYLLELKDRITGTKLQKKGKIVLWKN